MLSEALLQEDWSPYKKRKGEQGCTATEKSPGEDTVRRWRSVSQGERPPQKPTLLAL